jgi:colanic acid/amylovoran biosynthesis glycosyltransferase
MQNKILIILNKDKLAISETFIQNHIDFFNSEYKNSNEFKPHYTKTPLRFLTYILNGIELIKSDYKFSRFIKEKKIGLVLAEYGMMGAEMTRLCKKYNIPLVVHFHGHDAHRKSVLEAYKQKYQSMFEFASALIVVSNKMKDSLESLGAKSSKVILNGYGVDISKFSYKERKRQNDNFNILAIGRFVDKKAPYLLILVIQKLINKIPNLHFTLAGDGYLFETCKRMIIALNLEKYISLPGAIEHIKVKELMECANIYIQHSVVAFDGDSEGLPNSILEAAASGLPIVATSHAGISDLLSHRVNSLLIEENNIDEMASAIFELYENCELAYELAFKARKSIEIKHELNYTLSNLKLILEKAINER